MKILYYKDGNTSIIDLQIEYNLYRNSKWLLYRNWKANSKIHIKIQETHNSQNNLQKINKIKVRVLTFPNSKLSSNYNNQDSAVLA